jgi:hypothetical protein
MKAGRLGVVLWRFFSDKLCSDRAQLGLPSSQIIDTNVNLADRFLKSLSKNEFLVLLLG